MGGCFLRRGGVAGAGGGAVAAGAAGAGAAFSGAGGGAGAGAAGGAAGGGASAFPVISSIFSLSQPSVAPVRILHRAALFAEGGDCAGLFAKMEAKILLAVLLSRFTLEIDGDHPIGLSPSVTLRPTYGVKGTVRLRGSGGTGDAP